MITIAIVVFFILWTIIGGIFGLSLYADEIMPHDNKRKNNITVLILGPGWWIIRGLVIVYKLFRSWVESEPVQRSN